MQECHGKVKIDFSGLKKISLVGNPNVGKSVIFSHLTDIYVTVSNYPGTTVEVSRGAGTINRQKFEIIDTPGMNNLIPSSEDEKVTVAYILTHNHPRLRKLMSFGIAPGVKIRQTGRISRRVPAANSCLTKV